MTDNDYMLLALKEAQKAYQKNEVPVGCVIVQNDKVIAKAHNTRMKNRSVFDHAEIIAIKKASKAINSWILDNCTIYITLEPCLMCAGAIIQSRIERLVFAAYEPKHGASGSIINVFENYKFNHHVEVKSGVQQEASSKLLKSFFSNLR